MIKIIVYIVALVSASGARAEIREIKSMAEAFGEVQAGDLIVLDIDNTIYQPAQVLGSDQWFLQQVENYKSQGLSADQALEQGIQDARLVHELTKVHAVQNINPLYIRRAQRDGFRVMALTARPVNWKEITRAQLNSVHVNLNNEGLSYSEGVDVEYHQGVLFVGPRSNKGLVLKRFLEQTHLPAKRLIFVDDRTKHVENMEAAFLDSGLPNLNFRYGFIDPVVAAFNPELADLEWNFFKQTGRLLTDAQGEALLKRRRR